MKYLLVSISILTIIISGCGRPSADETPIVEEKTPFLISTAQVNQLNAQNSITKNGTIIGAQAVTVSSQVNGRVNNLRFQEGDTVNANTTVVQLSDTQGTFTFNAQRAKTQLDSALINYDATLVSLDKAIGDSSRAVKQATTQFNAASQGGDGSTALQLQQLEEQLKKAEFDYQTLLKTNQQTIQNYINTANTLVKDVQLLYESVRTESDKILGVSTTYRDFNDSYERALSVRNTSLKRQAEDELRKLISQESNFNAFSQSFSEANLLNELNELKQLTQSLLPVLDALDSMLQYTDAGSTLSQTQIDLFFSTVNGYQSQVQGLVSSITAQVNGMQSFLATYQEQEASTLKQVELLKQQNAITKENLQDTETNVGISLESAEITLETTQKSKETTLASLENAIAQARIAYNEAQTNLGKFTVESPIQGSIGQVLVDVGQEVSMGTPLFTVSSTNQQQVEVSLNQDDLRFAKVGQTVSVYIDDKARKGTIQSISSTANQNFTYKTVINLDETVSLFGDLVRVEIPIETPYALIPVNVTTIIGKNEGLINTWNEADIIPVKVQFGKVRDQSIEIVTELDPETIVITSDIKNYNPNKHKLTVASKK